MSKDVCLMKYHAACLGILLLLAGFTDVCHAHRVNVFAYVDGDAIQAECSFSKSRKVQNGKLLITDLETGAPLLEGITDEQGRFRFRPTDAFLGTGHGLNIRLLAGEGHQDDWQVSAEELQALSPPGQAGGSRTEAEQRPARSSAPKAAASGELVGSALGVADLEALVGRVVDAKLAPVRQTLARQQESGPDLRDIVGGIGWILGLLGLATYMKYRR